MKVSLNADLKSAWNWHKRVSPHDKPGVEGDLGKGETAENDAPFQESFMQLCGREKECLCVARQGGT